MLGQASLVEHRSGTRRPARQRRVVQLRPNATGALQVDILAREDGRQRSVIRITECSTTPAEPADAKVGG